MRFYALLAFAAVMTSETDALRLAQEQPVAATELAQADLMSDAELEGWWANLKKKLSRAQTMSEAEGWWSKFKAKLQGKAQMNAQELAQVDGWWSKLKAKLSGKAQIDSEEFQRVMRAAQLNGQELAQANAWINDVNSQRLAQQDQRFEEAMAEVNAEGWWSKLKAKL